MSRRRQSGGRRGVTLVEMGFVLSITLLFLCGVFEYGRYLMVLDTANNAAREGARATPRSTPATAPPVPR
jgi:Flp pilus assembly protein TadG